MNVKKWILVVTMLVLINMVFGYSGALAQEADNHLNNNTQFQVVPFHSANTSQKAVYCSRGMQIGISASGKVSIWWYMSTGTYRQDVNFGWGQSRTVYWNMKGTYNRVVVAGSGVVKVYPPTCR